MEGVNYEYAKQQIHVEKCERILVQAEILFYAEPSCIFANKVQKLESPVLFRLPNGKFCAKKL